VAVLHLSSANSVRAACVARLVAQTRHKSFESATRASAVARCCDLDGFALERPSHRSTRPTVVLDWLDTELEWLGARFDARNGNRFFSEELVEQLRY
jgi:hypothetical protein